MKIFSRIFKIIGILFLVLIVVITIFVTYFIYKANIQYKNEEIEIKKLGTYKIIGETREQKTGYPDGTPASHLYYKSLGNMEEIEQYYNDKLAEYGWSDLERSDFGTRYGIALKSKKQNCSSYVRFSDFSENQEETVNVTIQVDCN